MPPAARISDFHECPLHYPGPIPHVGGPIVSGDPSVIISGSPAARVGDSCPCNTPPPPPVVIPPVVVPPSAAAPPEPVDSAATNEPAAPSETLDNTNTLAAADSAETLESAESDVSADSPTEQAVATPAQQSTNDMIVRGSSSVLIGGMPAARLGDTTSHDGMITNGAATVLIGG